MIRKAREADRETLKDIAHDDITNLFPAFMKAEDLDKYLEQGFSDEIIDNHFANMIVFQTAGKVLGFCAYQDNRIDLVFVQFGFQGHGYGRKLVEHAEKQILRNFKHAKLQTFEKNYLAICFFERMDYKFTGIKFSQEYGADMAVYKK